MRLMHVIESAVSSSTFICNCSNMIKDYKAMHQFVYSNYSILTLIDLVLCINQYRVTQLLKRHHLKGTVEDKINQHENFILI